jgi:selenocysteine lyase/cysteine desulfurase
MLMPAAVSPIDGKYFERLRAREFARLDKQGLAYLDYTGSALYGASQIRAHQRLLADGIFGNPHSEHDASRASTDLIERAARLVLDFFDVTGRTHTVCFTANTTAAIKLVAESYPFDRHCALVLSADNHNSVNGVREFARRAGAPVHYLRLDETLQLRDAERVLEGIAARGRRGLLAYPAQSNFSGVRHPLSLVAKAQRLGFEVLLDAAAFVGSSRLDLAACPADFVACSFYKLFGFPTGLGALIARHAALARLRRPWFSGGTVRYVSVLADTHALKASADAFADGTPDFLGIAALEPGFAMVESAGLERIALHVSRLTRLLIDRLLALHHDNGAAMVRIYGPAATANRGGTVAFNVLDQAGDVIPFQTVEARARETRIALRGGCFCNPGASEAAFGYDRPTMARCLGPDFSIERMAECVGRSYAVGAVRASIGLANNSSDIERAVALVESFRGVRRSSFDHRSTDQPI